MTVIRPEDAEQAIKRITEQPEVITTTPPPDTSVKLPGGFRPIGESRTIREAEVRELTGADEEAISRTKSFSKMINTILLRGVESVGKAPVDNALFEDMLAGDRDALLIAIRSVTFGQYVVTTRVCPHCGKTEEFEIDLKSAPTTVLDDDIPQSWTIKCKVGDVKVSFPTGTSYTKIMDASDDGKTQSELNTILLAECLLSVDGNPSTGLETARSLSVSDRTKILGEIMDKNPGPKLGEVTSNCPSCGEQSFTPLSIADLFRFS